MLFGFKDGLFLRNSVKKNKSISEKTNLALYLNSF